ncbi:hypothetical protein MKW98_021283 [Papaver atlanticum]|uniref:Uncharacterized protein n=1 Tax=Papaver atlanticum TaxID=357466 RepID=A0AAD4SSI3_9MAGN|nr:hypothetical protein MKW98_021283 [Papaver atlanticum]
MMMNLRLVSQEHSQLPPKSFRLSPGLRANAALFLPWITLVGQDPHWQVLLVQLLPLLLCVQYIVYLRNSLVPERKNESLEKYLGPNHPQGNS